MALASYTDLVSAVSQWFPRADLVGTIPTFVTLLEARLNRNPDLRVRAMETTITSTPVNGDVTLPADFLEMRQKPIWLGSNQIPLEYATPDYAQAQYLGISDIPVVYSIVGNVLSVSPADNTNLQITYYQKIPGLQANSTNWLMTNHPDVYLCGTLVEAFAIERKADAASAWDGRLQTALDEIIQLDLATRSSGPMRVLGATP